MNGYSDEKLISKRNTPPSYTESTGPSISAVKWNWLFSSSKILIPGIGFFWNSDTSLSYKVMLYFFNPFKGCFYHEYEQKKILKD